MPEYKAPLRDQQFVLNEVLGIERYSNMQGFEEASADLIGAILEESAKVCEEVLQPLNLSGDQEGAKLSDGSVTMPEGFAEAYAAYAEGGWIGLEADPAWGGQGLPHVLAVACDEMAISANMAFSMVPTLSRGTYAALSVHGSDEQKETWLPNLVSGRWTGTMNLTEPHCGTDLGLLRTRADAHSDGTFRITGTKIFISAGDHDLAENIVHLVLARIPGGPEGSRGISLFIVPKYLLDADGNPGQRNTVTCSALEDKMGIHANPTCELLYEGATGYLVGEEHNGLAAMFTMMNHARLGVGLQGLSLGEVAYQNAAAYAKERLQGRSLGGASQPDSPADPIIVHPDVRRMLMTARSFNEGSRALALLTGLRLDISMRGATEEERTAADDWVQLLTPIVKAWLTDRGFETCVAAQQCFGGHGYIRDHGMEQFVRDSRIAMIYEGTNGIQALDLVGRKLGLNGARAVFSFYEEVGTCVSESEALPELESMAQGLAAALERLKQATQWLMENGLENPEHAGATSVDYLDLFALVAVGYVWLLAARTAREALASGTADQAFYENKLKTARFFMEKMLPETAGQLAKVTAGAEPVMSLAAEAF